MVTTAAAHIEIDDDGVAWIDGTKVKVVDGHQLNVTVGQCIEDLELIARATEPVEWINQVTYLPLK